MFVFCPGKEQHEYRECSFDSAGAIRGRHLGTGSCLFFGLNRLGAYGELESYITRLILV